MPAFALTDSCDGEFQLGNIADHGNLLENNQTLSIVFNNPFSNQLSIHSKLNQPSDLIIYNEMGIKMFQSRFSDVISIDTQNWKPGIYFIKLDQEITKGILTR